MVQHRNPTATRAPSLVAVAALTALTTLFAGCAASGFPAPPASPETQIARPSAPDGELPVALRDELQLALSETMAQYAVPGAAVGVWVPGQGSWTTTAGFADIETQTPVTVDMTWPLRSITKSYTVTLLLQLVDEGRVSLDDTIDRYVEGVTDGAEITLRELADMSSGNADYTDAAFLETLQQDPERIFTLQELIGFMLDRPEQFAPGTRKVYTNANTNLLGAVIEDVTGAPFSEVLRERILEPLGQNETRYVVDASTWTEPHAVGYAPSDTGLEPVPQNLSIFGPAGSMLTSLDDGRVWGEILGTGALLTPQTQAERLVGAPLASGPPYGEYALGIGETDGWWGHNGEGLGFTAAIFHQPDTGATIVVFMNESNLGDHSHPADQMFRRAAAILDSGAAQ